MKQFFSQTRIYFGQQRPRVHWLAVLALSLCLACVPLASPAFAAPDASQSASRANAGKTCSVGSHQVSKNNGLGFEAFWLKMETTWCYDGKTVTSHNTN